MIVIQLTALRTHRVMAGLSQRQLARHAGVSYQNISRLELGGDASEIPLGVLVRISAAVDVPVSELLDGFQPRPAPPCLDPGTLSIADARLLRKIATTSTASATLSKTERELTLPHLLRRGLVAFEADRLSLHRDVAAALIPQAEVDVVRLQSEEHQSAKAPGVRLGRFPLPD